MKGWERKGRDGRNYLQCQITMYFLIANLTDRILYDVLPVCESEMSVIYDMEGK